MLNDFKAFLTKSNALALAVGVIIGAATGKVVSATVEDILMPPISMMMPPGDWREAQVVLSRSADANGKITVSALKYGHFAGSIVDFVIISFVVFLITKAVLPKEPPPPATKTCSECLETIPLAAKRCKACTSVVAV